MPYSAFARYGNGFRYSSAKPLGQALFEQIRESQGPAYQNEAFEGPVAGRAFALAMMVARAHSCLERAGAQADPHQCYELLRAKLREYSVVTDSDTTLAQAHEALAAAMKLALGPSRGNVEYQLQTALGDDFVAWWTHPGGPGTGYPDDPWDDVGIFGIPPLWKTIRITPRIKRGGSQTVAWSHVTGDTSGLIVGDKLVVEPGKMGQQELITITARTSSTLTAVFTKAHEPNAQAFRRPWPFWMSIQLHSLVVVKNGRARDPKLRNKVRLLMRKLLGNNSTWDVVEENAAPGSAGPLIPGQWLPAVTPIQTATF